MLFKEGKTHFMEVYKESNRRLIRVQDRAVKNKREESFSSFATSSVETEAAARGEYLSQKPGISNIWIFCILGKCLISKVIRSPHSISDAIEIEMEWFQTIRNQNLRW